MPPIPLLCLYSLLILIASLAGGWIPHLVKLTHVRLQVATSFVSGLMLGVGMLHMLPHAWHETESIDRVMYWGLGGFLVMFFLQRFFHFHHHDVPEESPEGVEGCCDQDHVLPEEAGHEHHHDEHTLAHKSAMQLSWSGAALGLTLHTLIAGFALGASVESESHADVPGFLLGFGTFLVIFLHKPFDALTIATLMTAGGWSKSARHLVNTLFALVIPAGVLLFHLGAAQWATSLHDFMGAGLAFSAGTFICIAASDLLPELQFHSHDRIKLSVALMLGLALAAFIGQFERGGHEHHHEEEETIEGKLEIRSAKSETNLNFEKDVSAGVRLD